MHHLHPTGLAKLSFGSKTSIYEISRMLFLHMNFYFTYIVNFNFAHFEIEKSFGLTWVKLQIRRFHLQFSFRVFKGCSIQVSALILLILCIKKVKFKIWIKITEWSIRLKNFNFGARFTNYGVPFCSFWILKTFGVFW